MSSKTRDVVLWGCSHNAPFSIDHRLWCDNERSLITICRYQEIKLFKLPAIRDKTVETADSNIYILYTGFVLLLPIFPRPFLLSMLFCAWTVRPKNYFPPRNGKIEKGGWKEAFPGWGCGFWIQCSLRIAALICFCLNRICRDCKFSKSGWTSYRKQPSFEYFKWSIVSKEWFNVKSAHIATIFKLKFEKQNRRLFS